MSARECKKPGAQGGQVGATVCASGREKESERERKRRRRDEGEGAREASARERAGGRENETERQRGRYAGRRGGKADARECVSASAA